MIYNDKHLTKKVIYRDKSILTFVLNFTPSQSLPVHNHPGMVTIVQVITGSAEAIADGKSQQIQTGDILVVQEQEMLALTNGSENLSLCVTLTPGPTDERFAEEF